MRLEDIVLRSTRALQPAATSLPVGTLYFVTDELVIERSNGTTWQSYSGAASSGISQLTGAVTAGPGSGSQAATIANDAVTTAKIINDAVTYAKIQNVADARLLGRSAGSAGDMQEITVGSGLTLAAGALTAAGGSSDWTTTVVKPSDQDVVNSTTLVDDTALQLAVTAGSGWLIELLIAYSATDAAKDFIWDVTVSTGTMNGVGFYYALTAADAAFPTAIVVNAISHIGDIVVGTAAAHAVRMFKAEFTVIFSATGTFKFRFAENASGAATEARCKAGSVLRGKQII